MSQEVLPKFTATSYAFTPYVPAQNWIGGKWSDAKSGKTIPVENPRHAKAMSHVVMSGAEDVDVAVAAAEKGYAIWRATPIKERAEVFYRLKYLMQRDMEELAWLVSHENGKTFAESKASVEKGIECVEFG